MATRLFRLLTLAVLLTTGARTSASDLAARPTLDLNGVWDFRMDPQDEGVDQHWFEAGVSYPDKIRVPGNWQAQGFGEPRNHLRHDYQGRAWYRRTVVVPSDWAGQRIWIRFGGVTAIGDVYVNGKQAGSVEHFLTPFEFDITKLVRVGGENIISCRVDSQSGCHDPHRDPVVRPGPVGMFNFWGHWGGLYRPVCLEARSDPHIDTMFVTSDVKQGVAKVKVVLARNAPGDVWDGQLVVSVTPAQGGPTSTAEGAVHFRTGQVESDAAVVDVVVTDAHLWSPEDPFLYDVETAVLVDGQRIDAKRDRFGMREIVAGAGGTLLLNGKPYFIRGLGDDYVEPLTGTLVPDKNVYLERIRLCKRYGYNGFRYLAHTPTREVFDAADEAGFLILAEAPAYWNNWPRQDEIIPLYKQMVPQIIREHHNHPSWYAWSAGNEFTPTAPWMDYIHYAYDTFRTLDPTRLFIGSEGAAIFPMDVVTPANLFAPAGGAVDQPFNGQIAEVAYFKQSLSDAEMAELARPESGYAESVRSLQPSGYWRLNDTVTGKVADASGNGRDGACEESMPRDNLGQPGVLPALESGGSIRFAAGVPAVNLETVAPATFAADNQPFSVSMWLRPTGVAKGDWGTPFSCGSASTGSALLVSLDGEEGTGKVVIGLWMSNVAKSDLSLTAGEWNHFGATYDGATLRLYINGRPDTVTAVHFATQPVDGRIGNLIRKVSDANRFHDKPHIWHEFNNAYAGSLPDLSIGDKYTGVFQDNDCVAFHVREIADYGLTQRYPDIHRRSIESFYLYLKDFYEAARTSPTLDGYNYWLMTDLPGGVESDPSSLGILNMFYEPLKFPDPNPILRFNRETVILMSAGAGDRILAAGERKPITLSVSHYGPEPVDDGRLIWKVRSGSKVLQEGILDGLHIDVGQVREIGQLSISPGQCDRGEKLTLDARLVSSVCEQDNTWDFWVFPAKKRDFTGGGIVNLTDVAALGERYSAGSAIEPDKTRVVVTDRVDAAVLDYVHNGGSAVLLTESGVLKHPIPIPYWPQWLRSVGYVVEDHRAINEFPHDGFCTYQFYRLFGASVDALDLATQGSLERDRFTAAVWGLKAEWDTTGLTWSDPRKRCPLMRCGLICEGRIGRGRILTCSLRVLDGVRGGLPEAGYLLDCLVDAALAEPVVPQTQPLTVDEARQVFEVP